MNNRGWNWFKSLLPATKRDLEQLEKRIMATLDQVIQDVADETTLQDSILTLLAGIQQQLKDALAGVTLPPAAQTKIDQIFAAVEANKAKLSAAVAANTPAAP
jgi:hypothetical protein